MGQNAFGNIINIKSQPQHEESIGSKLKNSGQLRNVICEITGHAHESSLDDYDKINESNGKNCLALSVDLKKCKTKKNPNEVFD